MKEINDQLIEGIFLKPTIFSVILLAAAVITIIFVIRKVVLSYRTNENINDGSITYRKKALMTPTEYSFYLKMKPLEVKYKIIPQLNLASIAAKIRNTYYYTDLFRNIDYAIFTDDYSEILLFIELNDQTHQLVKRRKRDIKVQNICRELGIPLLTFYTKYPNYQDYVINRILKTIEKPKADIDA